MVKRKPCRGPKAIALLKLSPDGGHLADFKLSIVDSNAALLTLSRTCRNAAMQAAIQACTESSQLRPSRQQYCSKPASIRVLTHDSVHQLSGAANAVVCCEVIVNLWPCQAGDGPVLTHCRTEANFQQQSYPAAAVQHGHSKLQALCWESCSK